MTLGVYIDWLRDGTWTTVGDDVSLRARGSIAVGYGRDQSTALAPALTGSGSLVLDNTTRDYSPRNASSPLYGRLKPGRPVLITRTVGTTTYTIFVGHTDNQPINPDVAAKTVTLSLLDNLGDFRGQKVSTALYAGLRTGEAIGKVLDAVGWTGGRDLDLGGTVMPWWWAEGVDALSALNSLVAAEGPPALLTVGTSGELVFRDRHHRLLRAASLTSQGTWRGFGAEPVMGVPFSYDEAWSNIVNSATVAVDVRTPDPTEVVWSSTSAISLSDGETKLVTAAGSDPFTGAITPTGSDITLASGAVNVSLLRDSGAAVTIVLTATGGPAVVTALQLRASPVRVAYTTQVATTDTTSVIDYGSREYSDPPGWGTPDGVEAVLETTVAQRAQPLPVLSVKFQVGSAAPSSRIVAVLARNIGDRVTVIEPETQVSGDFWIERIDHQINGEVDHVVTFGLEAVPTQPTAVFILGSATRGVLGTNRLGRQGLDDPATVFVLGSGVLGTNLLGH